MVRDSYKQNPNTNLTLRLIGKRVKDGRTYNLPTASEVAALVVGDIGNIESRDIVIKKKSRTLKRISKLHPSYLPLQYPLLFPYGEDGYRVDIPHRGLELGCKGKRKTCSMREFFAFRIQERVTNFSLILNARRLFQQFLVDVYTMIDTERLNYIRNQQSDLRCDSFENLQSAKDNGNFDVARTGQRVILPSSFTGGARYMMQNYLDAMAICKWYGYPDFFITITCNPKWPEIQRFLKDKKVKPVDRPDILCRLFKLKLDSFIKDLKDNSVLGKVQAVVYTVEFQKRGLPHAHVCLFMLPEYKLPTVDLIDPFISAEIPDQNEDPELYSLVKDFMLHGPCGNDNLNSPCMIDNKCSKNFPKRFCAQTSIDNDGYPIYRRRDTGAFIEKSGARLDNRNVIPYNKFLLKRYQSHINVEWCNQGASIKYLFKYINKGADRTTLCAEGNIAEDASPDDVDEIKQYYDCRYLSSCEASWRIFSFDVHYRTPSVMRLPFHLPGKKQVIYGDGDDIENVLTKEFVASSMFEAWMSCNSEDPTACKLTYVEFPTKFVWKAKERKWEQRQKAVSIGRIHAVNPSLGEPYFLRILLNKVRGPKSFDDILTVNGKKCKSFREACFNLGLLDDDTEYIEAIEEANQAGSPYYLRTLFATMLLSDSLSRPEHVWANTWKYLSDDILYKQRNVFDYQGLSLTDDQIQNQALIEIEKLLLRNNCSLKKFPTMPYPDYNSLSCSNNRLISEELCYDRNILKNEFDSLQNALTDEQRRIFYEIMDSVQCKSWGVYFVYGYGGTGKTFLWKTLSAAIRSKGEIVLNVASSGIESLLLAGGRTAHSRFLIPLNLNGDSLWFIKAGSDVAELLKKTSLIIWDEAPMIHKHAFEAFDRSLKDILTDDAVNQPDTPFGGKVIVFGGDYRQILPVIPNGSRHDIVNASLSSPYIWLKCKVLTLTKNMRLSTGCQSSDIEETKQFSNWLLQLGEGNIGDLNDGESIIQIPEDLLITDSVDPVSSLINFVYPSILDNFKVQHLFQERAILAPTNEVVEEINDRLIALFPDEEKEYLSSDSICPSEDMHEEFDERLYAPDVLNGIKLSGVPNHKLILKVGVPIMLLRNIDQKFGLCNGTRLQVISLSKRVIEAEIISGTNIGTRTFIPRLSLTPTDKRLPYKFKRRQFPVSVCFAMTINKSQGQSLSRVGLYLKIPVFSHGQLYVALSRVKSKDGLKVLILDQDGKVTNTTTNVVYKEVFSNL